MDEERIDTRENNYFIFKHIIYVLEVEIPYNQGLYPVLLLYLAPPLEKGGKY